MAKGRKQVTSKRVSQAPRHLPHPAGGAHSRSRRRFSIVSDSEESESSEESEDSESGSTASEGDYRVSSARRQVDEIISSSSESDDQSSSSDDDNVDFVQLTKERARAMKAATRHKSPRKSSKKTSKKAAKSAGSRKRLEALEQAVEAEEDEEEELDDDIVDQVLEDEERKFKAQDPTPDIQLDDERVDYANAIAEEDLGEEVDIGTFHDATIIDETVSLEVPKFDDQEIDSDADYEFDKNDLIQALQNDNDDLELLAFGNSDDDYDFLLPEDDPYFKDDNYLLKEETDALVNDVNDVNDYSSSAATPRSSVVEEATNNGEGGQDEGHVRVKEMKPEKVKYLPAPEDSDEDDEDDEDLADIDVSAFDDIFTSDYDHYSGKRGQGVVPMNAIVSDEDDSDGENQLLQYFFSSDSSASEKEDEHDNSSAEEDVGDKVGERDGDETDEDTSLPVHSTRKIGSKSAKEVLSSSKNNFRAPVLGTFIISKTRKPFGIIDGISTRFLHPGQDNRTSVVKGTRMSVANRQRQRTQTQPSAPPIALDELLNISEFEDEEQEQTTSVDWDLFHERRVPLSAFRNKGVVNNTYYQPHPDATRKYSFGDHRRKKMRATVAALEKTKKRRARGSFGGELMIPANTAKSLRKASKRLHKLSKGRRQSVAEAQAEGLRPTKGGLFSEEILCDVEELLVDIGHNDDLRFLFGS
ncbi:hypothetical protein KL933_002471 [Ogataea haglerorum]|uniref:Protein IFH1 n=1 Tax=Ogataea haglerorum TaxID=1937702 RepID=A0AAN6D5T9_9ASCO|nr:hypothetical protein KL915_003004 [Ogataea haglerorum]KAG7695943.1 hypothetical protein KL951_003468 [Ogataea haglerorum]KAG7705633.1 hypothetical protein KL914_003471 [Ogataea haglerorum]KAG7707350.1 hypothetical protein KL950_003010 [Ogataea haglerorum]KAG7718354.1 hypothetical protein KL913_002349 [Ogataea haglerorum]